MLIRLQFSMDASSDLWLRPARSAAAPLRIGGLVRSEREIANPYPPPPQVCAAYCSPSAVPGNYPAQPLLPALPLHGTADGTINLPPAM